MTVLGEGQSILYNKYKFLQVFCFVQKAKALPQGNAFLVFPFYAS